MKHKIALFQNPNNCHEYSTKQSTRLVDHRLSFIILLGTFYRNILEKTFKYYGDSYLYCVCVVQVYNYVLKTPKKAQSLCTACLVDIPFGKSNSTSFLGLAMFGVHIFNRKYCKVNIDTRINSYTKLTWEMYSLIHLFIIIHYMLHLKQR